MPSAMPERELYALPPAAWAPGVRSAAEWSLWARGERCIERTVDAPALEFTDPLFRRRLGQLCRMTVQVVHDALLGTQCGDIPQAFITRRGDVARQFTVNRTLIQEAQVLPAAFSLSTFNAPIALASIACQLKSGYSVLLPSQGDFAGALLAATAPVLCGDTERVLLVYGDELVPAEYGDARPAQDGPLAFATVIAAQKTGGARRIWLPDMASMAPADFLRHLLQGTPEPGLTAKEYTHD